MRLALGKNRINWPPGGKGREALSGPSELLPGPENGCCGGEPRQTGHWTVVIRLAQGARPRARRPLASDTPASATCP